MYNNVFGRFFGILILTLGSKGVKINTSLILVPTKRARARYIQNKGNNAKKTT